MARIRTLKPDAPQHPKVGNLSDRAFRLWIGMITQADDDGRLRAHCGQFRVLFFGYQPKTTDSEVEGALREVAKANLCVVYEHEGKKYVALHDWPEHQRVSKTSYYKPSSMPSAEQSVSVPQCVREDSALDRIGMEGIGKEETLSGKPDGAFLNGQVQEVVAHLNAACKTSFRASTKSTIGHINARLQEGYTVADLKIVVDCKAAEWVNDAANFKWLRPMTLFAGKFESYLQQARAVAADAPTPGPKWEIGRRV